MVMDLLGPSLHELFVRRDRRFSLKTVLILADQMIRRVRFVHECGLIHRDLKPENFVMGTGAQEKTLYLVDFGLAKRYLQAKDSKECQGVRNQYAGTIGTPRYASIHDHLGSPLSRRDDLESLGYIFVYFLKGKLPWQGQDRLHRLWMIRWQQLEKMSEIKLSTPLENLCQDLPEEFKMYLNYCRKLEYGDSPDYDYLLHLFRNLYLKKGFRYDCRYDWTKN